MPNWNPRWMRTRGDRVSVEQRAKADAAAMLPRIWKDGLPDGSTDVLAHQMAESFMAQIGQESRGIPRYLFHSQERQREYLIDTYWRYHDACLALLDEAIQRAIPQFHAVPKSTPLPVDFHLMMADDDYDDADADESGSHRGWEGA